MNKKQTGNLGEDLAARFLISKGYDIIGENYYSRYGEIDLIAQKDQKTVFIEVKTRKNLSFGAPEESFTPKKVQSLVKCAEKYAQENRLELDDWQIDLIAIELNKDDSLKRIEHFADALW